MPVKRKRRKAPKKPPGKPGRPTNFSEKFAERIFQLAKEGKTDEEIALSVGIHVRTLYYWKHRIGGFNQALKAHKGLADDIVEQALFAKASGYAHKTLKIVYDQEGGRFVTHEYVEVLPPDTSAAKTWLENRRPKRWKERKAVEFTGKVSLEGLAAEANKPEEEKE